MPNSIIPSSVRYMWKNHYKSKALGKKIKIHEQDGSGGKCTLASAKTIFKFNGINISQKSIGKMAGFRKNIGTGNQNLASAMNDVFKKHKKKCKIYKFKIR